MNEAAILQWILGLVAAGVMLLASLWAKSIHGLIKEVRDELHTLTRESGVVQSHMQDTNRRLDRLERLTDAVTQS